MMVDLSREIGIVLLRRLEHDLGAIGELVRSEIDLSKAAFANQSAESVVSNSVKLFGGEFVEERLIGVGELYFQLALRQMHEGNATCLTLCRCSACSYSACVLIGGIKCFTPSDHSPYWIDLQYQPTVSGAALLGCQL